MRIEALICPMCGGPLARPPALPALVDCGYCGAAVAISPVAAPGMAPGSAGVDARITRAGTADAARLEAHGENRAKFVAALRTALEAKQDPERAIREAAAAHLDVATTETVARVSIALAREFERESGIGVQQDPNVLARLAEAYLRAVVELASVKETDINLPFLSANQHGPKHFQRRVSAASLAALIDGEVGEVVVRPAAAALPADEPPTPKKKKWWQF